MNAIEARDVVKNFKEGGRTINALRNVNLTVKKGQVYGLLGPNGAGKTTLIHILSTLIRPTSGHAKILGYDTVDQQNKVKRITGTCMGGTSFHGSLNAKEILNYFGMLYGLDKSTRVRRRDKLIKDLGIEWYKNKQFSDLSTGMRQKIAVAKSLLNDPQMLFLDEPTAGLDVDVAIDVRDYILDIMKERDMTVLLTSHQMTEVEAMCKRIAVINKGDIVSEGVIKEIRNNLMLSDVIHFYLSDYKNLGFLARLPGVIGYEVTDGVLVNVDCGKDRITRLISEFKKRKIIIRDMEMRKASFEELFLKIVGKERKHV